MLSASSRCVHSRILVVDTGRWTWKAPKWVFCSEPRQLLSARGHWYTWRTRRWVHLWKRRQAFIPAGLFYPPEGRLDSPVVQIMERYGYSCYQHLAPYFNTRNWKNSTVDYFRTPAQPQVVPKREASAHVDAVGPDGAVHPCRLPPVTITAAPVLPQEHVAFFSRPLRLTLEAQLLRDPHRQLLPIPPTVRATPRRPWCRPSSFHR